MRATGSTASMKSYTGKKNIAEALPEILYDESRFTAGVPDAVYFPQSAQDVRDVVVDAHASGTPVAIIGGKTGIAGGCVPIDGCIALCLSDMNRILGVSRDSDGRLELCCEPGVTLDSVSRFLANPAAWPHAVEGALLPTPDRHFYAPDPTETSAQIGGTVATNASGARSFRFGPTRAHITGLRVVLADGDALDIRRGSCREKNGVFAIETEQGRPVSVPRPSYRSPSVKNAGGYFSAPGMDFVDLFIGSEGTLGIFTQCTLRLMPRPRFVAGLSFFPDRNSAFGAASFFRNVPRISAIEYFDHTALAFLEASRPELPFELPDFPDARKNGVYWEYMESDAEPFEKRMDAWENALAGFGSSFEHTWSGFEPRDKYLLKTVRHAVPEAINAAVARFKRECRDIRKISSDTALPAESFERAFDRYMERIAQSRLEHAVFGHLGDFHLHVNLVPRSKAELDDAIGVYEEMMRVTVAAGGSVSAEHGIGKLKTRYLRMMYGDAGVADMAAVKSALDPLWLLNRETLLEYRPRSIT
jgi:D-lactate dehydrogenase (cytochrome)